MATVTSIAGFQRGGQTFLTATKNADASSGTTYIVRRKQNSAITSSSDGTLIGTLNADSWRLLWDDSATTENLNSGLLIPGSAGESVETVASRRMLTTEVLIVITTASGETGNWHYAIFTSDDPNTVTAGVNATSSPVAETYAAVPGVVLVNDWTGGGGSNKFRKYFAWEDYVTWYHGNWGYYGNKVVLTQSATADPLVGGTLYPVTLYLGSSAPSPGYVEPSGISDNTNTRGFYLSPVDMDLTGITAAPSYHAQHYTTFWTGYPTQAAPTTKLRLATAIRATRYTQAIAAISVLQIDSGRMYLSGSSFGGMGVHLANDAANTGVFAAADSLSGIPTYRRFTGCSGIYGPDGSTYNWPDRAGVPDLRLDTTNALEWGEWANANLSVTQTRTLPPALYGWGTDDTHPPCIFQQATDAAESAQQAVFSKWVLNAGHGNVQVKMASETTGLYLRFKTTEAYPAFSGTWANDDDSNMTASGQHNLKIDWQCSQHSITGGSAITDSAGTFAISFLSLSGSAKSGTVTIRNAQAFRPGAGAVLTWSATGGQSGSATRNSDGSVTVTGLSVDTTATRLTITDAGSPSVSQSPSSSSSVSSSASRSQSPSSSASSSPSPSSGIGQMGQYMSIVPSNSVDQPFNALYIGSQGNVAVVRLDNVAVLFAGAPSGLMIRVAGRRVNLTGTTASNIVATTRPLDWQ